MPTKITSVPAHKQHYIPVTNPVDAFTRTYWNLLSSSDYTCMVSLIRKGHIEVVKDADTRVVALIPKAHVKAFVDEVFAATAEG